MLKSEFPFVFPLFTSLPAAGNLSGFAGTAFLVAPDLLLTCRHVAKKDLVFHIGKRASATRAAVRTLGAKSFDIAILQFQRSIGHAEPLPLLIGLRRDEPNMSWLQAQTLKTVGYPHNERGATYHEAHVEFRSPDFGQDGLLNNIQINFGLHDGRSGSPVFVSLPDGKRACVGMLYLGGEQSSTSRFYAADALVRFMRDHGCSPKHLISLHEIIAPINKASIDGRDRINPTTAFLAGGITAVGVLHATGNASNAENRSDASHLHVAAGEVPASAASHLADKRVLPEVGRSKLQADGSDASGLDIDDVAGDVPETTISDHDQASDEHNSGHDFQEDQNDALDQSFDDAANAGDIIGDIT
jgi:hypothetical protein